MADRDQLRRALLSTVDVDEPVVVRLRHEPDAASARLLVSLGAGWVVDEDAAPCLRRCGYAECSVTVAPTTSAHEILQTRPCAQPGCIFDAETGSEYCREHPGTRKLQRGAVTPERLELARRVRALRDEGLLHDQIAKQLGISRSYSSDLAHDPDGSRSRVRKDGYRQPCPKCGTLMTGSDGVAASPEQCKECAAAERHDERYWNADRIIAAFQSFAETFGRPPVVGDTSFGLTPSQRSRWSSERLEEIEATSEFGLPAAGTVMREFGTWNDGIRAAGFEPNRAGSPGHRTAPPAPARQEVLALLVEHPRRPVDIARLRGVTHSCAWSTLTTLCEMGLAVKTAHGLYEIAADIPTPIGGAMARTFVVLERNGVGWIPKETVDALTAELAIEQVAAEEGEYVAVEARHWQPCSVAPVTRLAVVRETQPA